MVRLRWVGLFALVCGVCCCFSVVASALPVGRVYEMVSPIYKAGYGVSIIKAISPDGDGVAFDSLGGFDGLLSGSGTGANAYLARRGLLGWSTVAIQPPVGSDADFSGNLEETLGSAPLGPNSGVENFGATQDELLLHSNGGPNTVASWEVFGGLVMELLNEKSFGVLEDGASPEFCHVVVDDVEGALLEEASNTTSQIYELARGCAGEKPSLRLVGVKNSFGSHGEPAVINAACKVELGVGTGYSGSGSDEQQKSSDNAIADGGQEMFFTENARGVTSGDCEAGLQLFVRLGGSKTLEVSKPVEEECVEVPCVGALGRASSYFKGASEDGSRVFFTTTQSLVAGHEEKGNDLYMATIGCPSDEPGCEVDKRAVTSLTRVSLDPVVGESSEVQGVVRIAPDGSRIYFVARGLLSEGVNGQGQAPVRGADNLYVYDAVTNRTAFVADLCSGSVLSGVAEDLSCPSNLKASEENDTRLWGYVPEAQSAGQDAGFLVFTSYARLLPGDTNNASDVYRYDAETGDLQRVSTGEGGYDADGNGGGFNAMIAPADSMGPEPLVTNQREMSDRAISEDGTRIVFVSADPLSPEATNGLSNVYEWHEGEVSLVSSGTAEEPDSGQVISESGQDIFFTTIQGLIPQDLDGDEDIYDARLGGGFPPVPASPQPCSGDACQGPLTNPAPLLVPGSVSQSPGGNFAAPVTKSTVKTKKLKAKKKVKAKGGHKKKGHGKDGKVSGHSGKASRSAGEGE